MMHLFSSFVLLFAFLCRSSRAWFVKQTGFTSELDGVYYYSPPDAVGKAPIASSLASELGCGYAAITVITTDDAKYGSEAFAATKAAFGEDDVWSEAFMETMYIQYTGSGSLSSEVHALGAVMTSNGTASSPIPSGPYFMSSTGDLYQAQRLYSDVGGAFTEAVTTSPDGKFSVLPAGIEGQSLAIAVPSRLYFTKTDEKPLAGLRMGIKDIYDIAGLRTSNGNRAWYHFYPPAETTGTAVQRLIDAGAVIVGKMKTSQFANGETATADWVDYHAPFNPRGDGYQDMSSSSSGPGAGAGTYDWLDLTLGSDTGGSIRGPSEVQGLYGNRPSHGLVSLDHVMPLAPQTDTAGFLGRDPYVLSAAAAVMYGSNITFTKSYPTSILTVDIPASEDEAEDDYDLALIAFTKTLSEFLKAKVESWNYTESWAETGTVDIDLDTMMNTTYTVMITGEQTKNVRDPFYADYAAAYDGRRPFIDPTPLVRWGFFDNQTETVDEAIANKTIFMDWFNSEVLIPTPETCSSALMLYPGEVDGLVYRNEYWDPPEAPLGFGNSQFSIWSETPDFVVPIGEAAYDSDITLHEEVLPVTVDIMAAKGCDGMLFSLLQDLHEAGIIKTSATGRSSISGGKVLYKRQQQKAKKAKREAAAAASE